MPIRLDGVVVAGRCSAMTAKKIFIPVLTLVTLSMVLTSCGYIGALGRSFGRMSNRSIDDASREAMFQSLREIHAEPEAVTPNGEDSMR
jgi:hypothetical protein